MTPKKPLTPENALARAAALCSRSEHAEYDIRRKLNEWGITFASANDIIYRLISEKYIDEQRYATAFVRDKYRFDGWGRMKIVFALKSKHISDDAIENALTEIDEEEYAQALEKALRSKLRSLSGKSDLQKKASLVRFAASRGYEASLTYRIMPQIIECDEDF